MLLRKLSLGEGAKKTASEMHVARRIFSMAEVVVYLQSTSGLQVVDCARFGNKEPLVLFYGRYDRTQGLTPVSALHSVLSNSEAQF